MNDTKGLVSEIEDRILFLRADGVPNPEIGMLERALTALKAEQAIKNSCWSHPVAWAIPDRPHHMMTHGEKLMMLEQQPDQAAFYTRPLYGRAPSANELNDQSPQPPKEPNNKEEA